MKLEGIACVVPRKRVGNEEVAELVRFYSARSYEGNLRDLGRTIVEMLYKTGADTRNWRAAADKSIDLIRAAVELAISDAGTSLSEIDLLIYTGIDRGFTEPANASFVARSLGIDGVRCFDIGDACMAWPTAVNLTQALMESGEVRKALVVSPEFNMAQNGTVVSSCFTIRHERELAWKFPGMTVGEAVSATVLAAEPGRWNFEWLSNSRNAHLCVAPLQGAASYVDDESLYEHAGVGGFGAIGRKLYMSGMRPSIVVLRRLACRVAEPRLIFCHSVSDAGPRKAADLTGSVGKLRNAFAEFGNIASASVPCALTVARAHGELPRQERYFGWVASAGMKYACFEILT